MISIEHRLVLVCVIHLCWDDSFTCCHHRFYCGCSLIREYCCIPSSVISSITKVHRRLWDSLDCLVRRVSLSRKSLGIHKRLFCRVSCVLIRELKRAIWNRVWYLWTGRMNSLLLIGGIRSDLISILFIIGPWIHAICLIELRLLWLYHKVLVTNWRLSSFCDINLLSPVRLVFCKNGVDLRVLRSIGLDWRSQGSNLDSCRLQDF